MNRFRLPLAPAAFAVLAAVLTAFVAAPVRAQGSVTLFPSKDNTLFEGTGPLSNGAGRYLFAGMTNLGVRRRAVLAFDVAGQVPEGARVQRVTLQLNLSKTITGPVSVGVHRVLADWGEGASQAPGEQGQGIAAATGDATWSHTFFDAQGWSTPGGDFAATASAVAQVGSPGSCTWGSTDALVADVQAWIDDPASNFGWILVGDESRNQTAKRFDSRESPAEASRPALTIEYATGTARERPDGLPAVVRVVQGYPNPFARQTTIVYELAAPERVRLEVFDLTGRAVATVEDAWRQTGVHRAVFDAAGLPAGTYVYRLRAGATTRHGTLVLAR